MGWISPNEATLMSANPFTFGNPIRDPARFYGRVEDIRQIVNRLRSSAHESTSVVGERRIGKTSLLKHLDNPEVAAGLGLPPRRILHGLHRLPGADRHHPAALLAARAAQDGTLDLHARAGA